MGGSLVGTAALQLSEERSAVLEVAGELGGLVQILYQWLGHTGPIGLRQGQVAGCVLFNIFTLLARKRGAYGP
jgi:hypothetical protein